MPPVRLLWPSSLLLLWLLGFLPWTGADEGDDGGDGGNGGNGGDVQNINIGGIFEVGDDSNKEIAFRLAVDVANEHMGLSWYSLTALPVSVDSHDPFSSNHAACTLFSSGVVGIVGPSDEHNLDAVQSACDNKDIPLIETRWDRRDTNTRSSINIYPYGPHLARAYVDIVKAWEWTSFGILYENSHSLFKMSELINMHNSTDYSVSVYHLKGKDTGDYRATLKRALKSGETNFLLDCSIDSLEEILKQAQQVGLITSKYSFIISNLDMHTIDLVPYQYAETNITGIRILNPEELQVMVMSEKLQNLRLSMGKTVESFGPLAAWKLRTETALTYDAVLMLSQTLKELEMTDNFVSGPVDCQNTDNGWKTGLTVINLMKTNVWHGLTGVINFDHYGRRSDFALEVTELREGGITTVGKWSLGSGLNITRVQGDVVDETDSTLANRTFIVITALTAPYAMLKESPVKLSGNDQYEGFGVDLIDALSKLRGFNYTFIIRDDSSNGVLKNGRWTGMIGDVIDGVADLAIADLTITIDREQAVDFTSPFMTLGISILYQKPSRAPPSFFSFADPFGTDIWLLLAAAYFSVSISLFVMEEPEFLVNQFSLKNSFWFTTGSLVQQGSEIAPIAISTRMVAGIWWFFTLIMVSSYTANLAAFLTTDTPEILFSNVKELVEAAESAGIAYGAKAGGATADFFKGSSIPEYKAVSEHMEQHPGQMEGENINGVLRAEREKYAFFMESSSIEYEVQRHCNLTEVGNRLADKGYGIAMRKNSTYRHLLSTAVLRLQESGTIEKLKRKWWQERGGKCSSEPPSQEAKPLELINVSGIFWVTLGGAFLAFVFVLIEMALDIARRTVKNRVSFKEEVKREVKFYFNFEENTKPVAHLSKSKSSLDASDQERKSDGTDN